MRESREKVQVNHALEITFCRTKKELPPTTISIHSRNLGRRTPPEAKISILNVDWSDSGSGWMDSDASGDDRAAWAASLSTSISSDRQTLKTCLQKLNKELLSPNPPSDVRRDLTENLLRRAEELESRLSPVGWAEELESRLSPVGWVAEPLQRWSVSVVLCAGLASLLQL